jgi:hypothetical protein
MIKGSLPSSIVAVVLLAACHGDSSPAPVTTIAPKPHAPAGPKRGPTPEELTAGMVEAVTTGKSTVPVAVKFDLPQRPTVGVPFDVVIAVMPQAAANAATVQATGSDGLQVAANVGPIDIPSVDPTQVYRASIPVTSTAEGVHFLNLSVSIRLDETTESRMFTVPIIVAGSGDATAAPPAPPGSAAAGKRSP